MSHIIWLIFKKCVHWEFEICKKIWRFLNFWKNGNFRHFRNQRFLQFVKWRFSPTRKYFRRFLWLKFFKIVKTRHFSKLPIKYRFRRKLPNRKSPKFLKSLNFRFVKNCQFSKRCQNSPISSRPEMSFLCVIFFMCHRYESYFMTNKLYVAS